MSLYDLPRVLFENYLKELGLAVTGTVEYHEKKQTALCTYAIIPIEDDTDEKQVALVLFDARHTSAHKVKLMVLQGKLKTNGKTIELLNEFGSIYTESTSCGERNFKEQNCWQYWLATGTQLGINEMQFSFHYSVNKRLHLLELAKRGQLLFIDKEYEWINSYYLVGKEMVAAEVNGNDVSDND